MSDVASSCATALSLHSHRNLRPARPSPPFTVTSAFSRHPRPSPSSPRRRGSRPATTPNQWIPACAGKTAIEIRADRSHAPRGNACQDALRSAFVRSRSASLILHVTFSPSRRAGGNAWPFPPAPQRVCSRPIATLRAVPVLAHCCVTRHSFGITKSRDSRLALRQNRRRRGRDWSRADPMPPRPRGPSGSLRCSA